MFKEFKYDTLEGKPDGFKFTAKMRCGGHVNCIYISFYKAIFLSQTFNNQHGSHAIWYTNGKVDFNGKNTELDIVAYEVPDPEVEVGKTYIAVGPNILESDKVEVEILKKDGQLFVGLCYKLKIIVLINKCGTIIDSLTITKLLL